MPKSWKEFREEEQREHLGTKGVMDALQADSAYPTSIQWRASFRLPMSKLCVLFLLISIWNYHLWHSFRSSTSHVSVFEENWNASPVTLKWELKIQKQVKAVNFWHWSQIIRFGESNFWSAWTALLIYSWVSSQYKVMLCLFFAVVARWIDAIDIFLLGHVLGAVKSVVFVARFDPS